MFGAKGREQPDIMWDGIIVCVVSDGMVKVLYIKSCNFITQMGWWMHFSFIPNTGYMNGSL